MVKIASILGRGMVLFFALQLTDVPVVCPDEWQFRDASSPTALAATTVDAGRVMSASGPESSECGCPCHHTFGERIPISLQPPERLTEAPPAFVRAGPPPPPQDLRHPPQNLA